MSTDLRVVHVSAHYPPFLGGAEKVVQALVLQQRKRGINATVLTSLDGRRARYGDEAFIRRFWSFALATTYISPRLVNAVLRLPRSSLVHVHITQAVVPEAVYAAHVLRGVPYVAHLHLDVGPSSWAGFLLRAWKPLVLARVLRAAEAVVVFTEEQRAAVASNYGVDPGRVVVIPNGVDESFFEGDERTIHSRPRLLFVGRLAIQKNLPLFLNALAGVSERFDTTLVGDGELEAELKQLASDLGLRNVRFHGRADGPELQGLYRNADVFVLPSEREGMPLVLLEALAMGLPIVATDISGNRDVVAHGENGLLVPPGDPAAFRHALLEVTSGEDYRQMSTLSRKLADRYSWEAVADQVDRVYQAIGRR